MLGGGRGSSGDFDGESGGRSRAPATAGAKTGAAGSGSGGTDFEDFPGALEETDDDLPF
jgi:single-strand DNA-binding protein